MCSDNVHRPAYAPACPRKHFIRTATLQSPQIGAKVTVDGPDSPVRLPGAVGVAPATDHRPSLPEPFHVESLRIASRDPRRDPRPVRRISRRVFPPHRRGARLSRGIRRRAHQGRLAGRADPAGIRRLGARAHRGVGHHGGDQPLRRQLRRLPRPDVQHGHAAAPRLRRAEAGVPAEDRERRAAPAVDGRHRADHRHRHDEDQDDRREEGRPLRRQRPEGVDLARPALRPHDPARAHDAVRPR